MSFLEQIKRRKMFQVAAVYAVTAWLLVQVITAIEAPLSLPEWFDTSIIVLLAVGFPITLVMSWAFNLTPQGIVRDEENAASTRPRGHAIEYVLVSLLVVAIGWIAFRESGSPGFVSSAPPRNSLAVLPFENLSPDPDNDYMAAGFHEEIIKQLSKLSGLSVRPRTAVLRYQSDRPPVEQIGAELNVATLLDASFRYADDRMRITPELIDVGSGNVLWAETYDEGLQDVFSIESNIAANVAANLQVALSLEDQQRISARPTSSADAYVHHYMRGRYLWNQRNEEAIEKALEYYRAAIDLDPAYALAYVGIADVWIFRGWYSVLSPRETFPNAKAAVEEALERDANLAAAYASRAHIGLEFDHDWEAAERDYRRAVELDPSYAVAHHWYGGYLSAMGRHEEALEQALAARELEPLSPIINTWVGLRYYFDDRYDAAIDEIEDVLTWDEDFAPGLWHLGWAYEQVRRFDDAIAVAAKAYELTENPIYLASLGHAHAMAGNDREARDVLARLADIARERHVSAYHVATVHIALGETDEGFRWLATAREEQSPWIGYLRVDPRLDSVRDDPRLDAILSQVGLDF
jgi:TolB-like protein/Flp pilus assembly protein TadD